MVTKHIILYYTKGTSDKEYQIHMQPDGTGYTVYGLYGRRGRASTKDVKVTGVTQSSAEVAFSNVLDEKRKKGYTTDISGSPHAGIGAATVSGTAPTKPAAPTAPPVPPAQFIVPHALSAGELDGYLDDDDWILQPLPSNPRLLVHRPAGGKLTVINEEGVNLAGLSAFFPAAVEAAVNKHFKQAVLEGYLDPTTSSFVVVDGYTQDNTKGEAARPLEERLRYLSKAIKGFKSKEMEMCLWYENGDKGEACAVLQDMGRAGVMLRRAMASYVEGPQARDDATVLKHEFAMATA
jgi:predicted DNA-binding WGR domain protein